MILAAALRGTGWRAAAAAFLVCCAMAAGAAALSPQAQLGRKLFFDASLSAAGKLSCASCHDPDSAYGPPADAGVVVAGGGRLERPGLRTAPSLRYLDGTPRFTRHAYTDRGVEREDIGPAGGFMRDGRADTLEDQALIPLLDPDEMANDGVPALARRLRGTAYAGDFARAFPGGASGDAALARQAATALAAFQREDPGFHPYSSRFDVWRRGGPPLTPEEQAGLRLFLDPAKGNCAACHTAATGPGGAPPVFTDHSHHALGVPRNPAIAANADPGFFDLGVCGPRRADLRGERAYCGYFKTPTLRNVARRRFFFHNGSFGSLKQVLRFYVQRDTDPGRWYPRTARGVRKFDDLPAGLRGNVDISDAPLNRDPGQPPALDDTEIARVIAFLRTLDDAQ